MHVIIWFTSLVWPKNYFNQWNSEQRDKIPRSFFKNPGHRNWKIPLWKTGTKTFIQVKLKQTRFEGQLIKINYHGFPSLKSIFIDSPLTIIDRTWWCKSRLKLLDNQFELIRGGQKFKIIALRPIFMGFFVIFCEKDIREEIFKPVVGLHIFFLIFPMMHRNVQNRYICGVV